MKLVCIVTTAASWGFQRFKHFFSFQLPGRDIKRRPKVAKDNRDRVARDAHSTNVTVSERKTVPML